MGVRLQREEAIKVYIQQIKQSKTSKSDYAVLVRAKANLNLTNHDIYALEQLVCDKIPKDKKFKKIYHHQGVLKK